VAHKNLSRLTVAVFLMQLSLPIHGMENKEKLLPFKTAATVPSVPESNQLSEVLTSQNNEADQKLLSQENVAGQPSGDTQEFIRQTAFSFSHWFYRFITTGSLAASIYLMLVEHSDSAIPAIDWLLGASLFALWVDAIDSYTYIYR